MSGILGKKLGMTQVFDEAGDVVPVTVIQAGPCVVIQKKTAENDGYEAIQVGFEELPDKKAEKRGKTFLGHFKKKNVKPFRHLREFRVTKENNLEVGHVLTVETFQVGDLVKVTGISKGKGFQGVIKRHGKAGGPASHGSRFHRTTGSIGQRTSPGEVFKNMKLPGHLGDKRKTVKNLKVIQVRPQENVLLVRGAIPGAKNNLVMIRKLP
jgi:large subunit ribosomal protein L3